MTLLRFDTRPLILLPFLFLVLIGCASLGAVEVKWASNINVSVNALVVRSFATSRIGRMQDDANANTNINANINAIVLMRSTSTNSDGEQNTENEQLQRPLTTKSMPTTTATTTAKATTTTTSAMSTTTRRDLLANTYCSLAAAAAASTTLALTTPLPPASAAEPIQARDTDSILAIARRKLRPKPPRILRRKLSQDFAVLLMRSSYNALDEMDCVAMEQFQRDFFLIRVSEYETYTKNLGAGMVTQGDLTDPYYFDFISFAQYKTINREVTQDPPYVFEEQQMVVQTEGGSSSSDEPTSNTPARFVPVVVQRDPNLTNKMLVPTHDKKVGAKILDKLQEIFADTDSRIPTSYNNNEPGHSATLLAGIRQIVNIFLLSGYAFKGNTDVATTTAGTTTYVVTLSASATLWSGKVLQQEGDPLNNNFLLKTLTEYIRRCGYSYENIKSSIKYEGTNEEVITITVR